MLFIDEPNKVYVSADSQVDIGKGPKGKDNKHRSNIPINPRNRFGSWDCEQPISISASGKATIGNAPNKVRQSSDNVSRRDEHTQSKRPDNDCVATIFPIAHGSAHPKCEENGKGKGKGKGKEKGKGKAYQLLGKATIGPEKQPKGKTPKSHNTINLMI
ncbi:8410_t:CDS:2, partial [Gigaspora rosea]